MSTSVPNSSILLVGIEENIAKLASADLKEAGYRPLIVPSIDIAFPEVKSWQPAMIILDRFLAAEAGVNFCSRLRSQGSRVYIILLVSQETLEERLACLEAGADDYFLKPYNSQSFLKLIRFYLQPLEITPEQLRFGDLVLDLANFERNNNPDRDEVDSNPYSLVVQNGVIYATDAGEIPCSELMEVISYNRMHQTLLKIREKDPTWSINGSIRYGDLNSQLHHPQT